MDNELFSRHLKKQVSRSILILFLVALVVIPTILWINDFTSKQKNLQKETILTADQIAAVFDEKIQHQQDLGKLLQEQWVSTTNESMMHSENRFNTLVPAFFEFTSGISSITWINTQGIIEYEFPDREENSKIGLSVSTNDAFIEVNQTWVIGTCHSCVLDEENSIHNIYYPLIYNSNLTGFFGIDFDTQVFCDEIIQDIPFLQNYYIEVEENHRVIYSTHVHTHYELKYTQRRNITFYNLDWELIICPKADYFQEVSPLSSWGILVLGISFAAMGLYSIYTQRKFSIDLKKEFEKKQKIEEELFQSQKMEALGTLAGGIVHDSNNILMSFQGYLSLIDSNKQEMASFIESSNLSTLFNKNLFLNETGEYITEMQALIERMTNLNKQILQFSRHDVFNKEIIDLNKVLTSVLTIFKKTIDKRIQISFQPLTSPTLLNTDKNVIQQILMNILINSRDAMPEGGKLTVTLKIIQKSLSSLSPKKKWIEIEIEDTGMGIPEKNISQVFDPFFTSKDKSSGTGLGLSIVYQAMEKMGGTVLISSKEHIGTKLSLYFPYNSNLIQKSENSVVETQESTTSFQGLNILIIEDELNIIFTLSKYLTKLEINVDATLHSLEGLEIFMKNPKKFHFIILDINLPLIKGTEICQRILKINPQQQFLFITGYSEYSISIPKSNFLGVLMKPFEFKILYQILKDNFCEFNQI